MLAAVKAVSDKAMKHDNYGRYVITSSKTSFPLANFELTKVC
jgi:hypothetical protein